MIKILIIDNDKERQKRTCKNLNNWGCDTVPVKNSADLSGKVKTTSFDLILFDTNLPDQEFKDDIEIIKKYCSSVNIIALTGLSLLGKNRHAEYIKQVLDGVILKPYKMTDIIFTIETLFQKNKIIQKAGSREFKSLTPAERQKLRKKRHRDVIRKRFMDFTQKFLSKT